jgi:hypothetical protein
MSTGATFLSKNPLLQAKVLLLTMIHVVACLGTLSTRLDNWILYVQGDTSDV